jgi:hypothetical protein
MDEDEYRSLNETQYERIHFFVLYGSRLASYTALSGKNTRLEGSLACTTARFDGMCRFIVEKVDRVFVWA